MAGDTWWLRSLVLAAVQSMQHSASVTRCLSDLVKKKLVHPVKKLRECVNFVYMHTLT